jgi:acyl phosphate:glycerol-3-phosphate acyltransferase
MSIEHPIAAIIISAYLLGSIPFGYLLVRLIFGSDVRQTGSGSIGATNVSRTSPVLGLITLALDALKGFAAVGMVLAWPPGTRQLAFAAAFAAICGHVFPVWLRFRGGKGVATGLGSFVLLVPKAVLIAIALFLALAVAFRWIALGSIVASASLPLVAYWFGEIHQGSQAPPASPVGRAQPILWLTAGALLIVAKHHSNIRRMLVGSEPRFQISHK